MLHCARIKVVAIKKPGFERYEENWLLIYDNWPLPGVHHKVAMSLFETQCKSEGILQFFNRLFVLDSKYLCEIGNDIHIHPLQDPAADGVGMPVARHPLHGSVRAELPHTAPTLGDGDSTSK